LAAVAEKPPTATLPGRLESSARRALATMLLVVAVLVSGEHHREWWGLLIRLASGDQGQAAVHDLITPNSGEQILPRLVRDMLVLLRQNDVKEYTLSAQIWADTEVWQRIVESAFPRIMSMGAPYLLARVGEQLPAGCRQLAIKGGIQIAACD